MNCRNVAMNYLARREHSRRELAFKLTVKGEFDQSEIEKTLDELEQDNLLSDERYAEAYCRSRIGKGYGPVKIRVELLERGIDKALIERTLSYCGEDWIQLASSQWHKKFADKAGDFQEWSRQAAFLQRRGFTSEQIRAVLDET
jgi:regulatory protein